MVVVWCLQNDIHISQVLLNFPCSINFAIKSAVIGVKVFQHSVGVNKSLLFEFN